MPGCWWAGEQTQPIGATLTELDPQTFITHHAQAWGCGATRRHTVCGQDFVSYLHISLTPWQPQGDEWCLMIFMSFSSRALSVRKKSQCRKVLESRPSPVLLIPCLGVVFPVPWLGLPTTTSGDFQSLGDSEIT